LESLGYENFSALSGWLEKFRKRYYNTAFKTFKAKAESVNVEDIKCLLLVKDYLPKKHFQCE
jgi:hypothetical protein